MSVYISIMFIYKYLKYKICLTINCQSNDVMNQINIMDIQSFSYMKQVGIQFVFRFKYCILIFLKTRNAYIGQVKIRNHINFKIPISYLLIINVVLSI